MTPPTLHIFLELPGAQCLSHLEAHDAILDLSFIVPAEPLQRAVAQAHPTIDWLTHDLTATETFQAVRTAYLDALSALVRRPLINDQSLSTLLHHDQVNLWWFTELSQRRFRVSPIPQMLMRRWWILHGDGHDCLLRACHQRTLTLWSNHPDLCAQWIEQLRALGIYHGPVQCRSSKTAERIVPKQVEGQTYLTERTAWQRAKTHLNTLNRYHRILRKQPAPRNHPQRADVLVVTYASGWHTPADGQPVHRYLGDIAHAMHDHQINMAWLPGGYLPESVDKLKDTLPKQPLPVYWPALQPSYADLLTVVKRLQAPRQRFEKHLPSLWHHPKLTIFGQDITPWLLPDLADLMDEELFKYYWLQSTIERAAKQSGCKLIVYRDEFYLIGRAVSSAKTPGVKKWAMQHGLITEDHWTYLYTEQETQPPLGLPAPDVFFAYGQYTQSLMQQWGMHQTEILPIGSLRHDTMIARTQNPPALPNRATYNLPDDGPICVICTQLIPQIPGWIERLVSALQLANIDAHIAIKQHHFHRADDLIEETFQNLGWTNYSVHTQHLEPLLRHADVALTENSTTGIEAMLWQTPLICFDEPARYESFPYVTHGGALSGQDTQTMAKSLRAILEDRTPPNTQAFLTRHLQNIHAPAQDAFLQHVRALLSNQDA